MILMFKRNVSLFCYFTSYTTRDSSYNNSIFHKHEIVSYIRKENIITFDFTPKKNLNVLRNENINSSFCPSQHTMLTAREKGRNQENSSLLRYSLWYNSLHSDPHISYQSKISLYKENIKVYQQIKSWNLFSVSNNC